MHDAETNQDKLKAVIAYIAAKKRPGKVKLFKLLYLIDFEAQVRLGQSVTGESYENFPMGPVPRTLWREFDKITQDCVQIEVVPSGMSLPEQRFTPKPGTTVVALSREERGIIDEVLEKYGDKNGARLRDMTHRELPYRLTDPGAIIPYYLAAYRYFRKPTPVQVRKVTTDPALITRLRAMMARSKKRTLVPA
jgi:uncharacterized phage-associated protein